MGHRQDVTVSSRTSLFKNKEKFPLKPLSEPPSYVSLAKVANDYNQTNQSLAWVIQPLMGPEC